jgi:outer membrane protein assembly factor BamB
MKVFQLTKGRFLSLTAAVGLALGSTATLAETPTGQWLQWGGPNQDWKAEAQNLADEWPEGGPPQVWSRDLGEGYSAILVDNGKLYTMYRADEKETVVCLNAEDGKTVWEHAYACEPAPGHVDQFGKGPRSTPLIVGDKLFTAGVAGTMLCLNKSTGDVNWKQELWQDHKGSQLPHGYSSSPFAYKNTVIVLVGGEGHSIMAFDQNDGKIAWQSQDFENSYSTPKLISYEGADQLLCYMGNELVDINPENGELNWKYDIGNQFKQNICLPVFGDDGMLFFSTTMGGSRGVKLAKAEGKPSFEEVWSTRKMQLYHVTSVGIGDWVYGCSGGGAPHFFSAINRKTGDLGWRERGFGKTTCVYADGKFIMLDEDGTLALATCTPEEFKVHSKAKVLEQVAWTVPTVAGNRVYLRDQKKIMALDLGTPSGT